MRQRKEWYLVEQEFEDRYGAIRSLFEHIEARSFEEAAEVMILKQKGIRLNLGSTTVWQRVATYEPTLTLALKELS